MKKKVLGRFILIGITALLAVIFFLPDTPLFKYMPEWWQKGMPNMGITLGLDLQGGLHLVYEVDGDRAVEIYLREESVKKDIDAEIKVDGLDISILPMSSEIEKIIKDDFTILDETNPGVYRVADEEADRISDTAVEQALETIRNRIDQFGVAEPTIHRQAENEIIIQLPGVKDPKRAIDIIGKTAQLEFKIVDDKAAVAAELPQVIAPADEQSVLDEFKDKIPPEDEILFRRLVDESGKVMKSPFLPANF
jgi:preprotein translocase subunit SecD